MTLALGVPLSLPLIDVRWTQQVVWVKVITQIRTKVLGYLPAKLSYCFGVNAGK